MASDTTKSTLYNIYYHNILDIFLQFLGVCSNSSALAVDSVTNLCKKGPKIWCLSANISKLCKVI